MGCALCCPTSPAPLPSDPSHPSHSAKQQWTAKWANFLRVLRVLTLRSGHDRVFAAVLRLYADQPGAIRNLYDVFDRNPVEFRFYLPQLASALVKGTPVSSGSLEVFLLDKCERSLLFAHRLFWFLQAFQPNSSLSSTVLHAVSHTGIAKSEESSSIVHAVVTQGAIAAFRAWRETELAHSIAMQNAHSRSAYTSTSVGGDGDVIIPMEIDPETKNPLGMLAYERSSTQLPGGSETVCQADFGRNAFMSTLTFVSHLTQVAEQLTAIPPNDRNAHLRTELDRVNALYGILQPHTNPQSLVYLPIGNCNNRLVRVHAMHSFCFRTNTRAPYLVVFEVVDCSHLDVQPVIKPLSRADKMAATLRERSRQLGDFVRSKVNAKPRRSPRNSTLGDDEDGNSVGSDSSMGQPKRPASATAGVESKPAQAHSYTALEMAMASPDRPLPPLRQHSVPLGQWSSPAHFQSPKRIRKRRQRGKTIDYHPTPRKESKSVAVVSPKTKLSIGNADEADFTADLGYTYTMYGTVGGDATETKVDDTPRNFFGYQPPVVSSGPSTPHGTDDEADIVAVDSPGSGLNTSLESQPPRSRNNSDTGLTTDSEKDKFASTAELNFRPPAKSIETGTSDVDTEKEDSKSLLRSPKAVSEPSASNQGEVLSVVFREKWALKEEAMKRSSAFGGLPGWRLVPVIVKANDDLRQEQFAAQLLKQFASIFVAAKIPVYMRPYDILAVSPTSGLIEAIPDTISLDALKRGDTSIRSLNEFFVRHFGRGDESSLTLKLARANFAASLAAYSIVTYLLQIRDRHNGNILLDADGHIVHIDFGYLLTVAPGGVQFERSPFKLTSEFADVLGGPSSKLFRRFRGLCVQAFIAARKRRDQLLVLVEMMLASNSSLPCFVKGAKAVMSELNDRFLPDASKRQCEVFVNGLIDA